VWRLKNRLVVAEQPEQEAKSLAGSIVAFTKNGELQGVAFRSVQSSPLSVTLGRCRLRSSMGLSIVISLAVISNESCKLDFNGDFHMQGHHRRNILPCSLTVHLARADRGRNSDIQFW
jgi:hypothetical protein